MSSHTDYILGTDPEELARLGLQARLWSDSSVGLWKRAGFRPGQTILDAGCGPGFAARDLAGLLGPAGRVIAVDESPTFLNYLNANSASGGAHLAPITTVHADVHDMAIEPASVDGAYSRWVLCFVKDPQTVVDRIARALKPGASLAVQDYINYRAMTWGPGSTTCTRVVEATAKSWELRGGDPAVGLRLPSLMQRSGLRIREVRSLVRVATPRDALWAWPDSFFRIFVPKLVAQGFLTPADHDAWLAEWEALSADPTSVFNAPNMVEVIAEKPG